MDLSQLLYISRTSAPWEKDALAHLITQCRRNNHKLNITGLLLYGENSFMQVFEGPSANVHKLFRNITDDDRHTDVYEVYRKQIPERHFSTWRMGFRYLRTDIAKEELLHTTIASLADEIDRYQRLPHMRTFMTDFYSEPSHDVFEGWIDNQ